MGFLFAQRQVFEAGTVLIGIAVCVSLWQYKQDPNIIASVHDSILIRSAASGRDIDRAFAAVGAPALVGLGNAFKRAERDTGINALFLAAIAIHESDRGTSNIARQKNNLFGWGAYDSDPFESAYAFATREIGISYVASRLKVVYVDGWGLKTIDEIGRKYASDSGWGIKVFNWVWRLQNEIYYRR